AQSTSSSASERLSFNAAAGTYYIVVDGATAADQGSFRLKIDCDNSGGTTSGGGTSGGTGSGSGTPTFACSNAVALACGSSYNLTNAGGNNLLGRSNYGGCVAGISPPFTGYSGNDHLYTINVPANQEAVIDMTGLSSNLDLFVFTSCNRAALGGCLTRSINTGRNDEQVTIPARSSATTYYLAVDGYNAAQVSNFTLAIDCRVPCPEQIDNDCDFITFTYQGIRNYNFEVPSTLPIGVWSATNSEGNTFAIGTGRNINRRFNYEGVYEICYNYQDMSACDVQCCKNIFFDGNPYECENIATDYDPITEQWTLSLLNVPDANVLYWLDDTDDSVISTANSVITLADPNAPNCHNVCVYYKNPNANIYQVCCVEVCENESCIGQPLSISCPQTDHPVCGCDGKQYQNICYARKAGVLGWVNGPCAPSVDADCDDLDFNFLSALRYSFSVPDTFPTGNWVATGGGYGASTVRIGNTNTLIVDFPAAGTYTICFRYIENGESKECCRTLSVLADPYECRDLRRILDGENTTIFIPGIAAENVVRWNNDDTGEELAVATDSLTVPIPAPDACGDYSVLFYDAGCDCFRVCCISFCTPAGENTPACAIVENPVLTCSEEDESTFNYSFRLANNSGLGNLIADVTILSSIGPTFENCANVTTLEGIGTSTVVSLNLVQCIVPIQSGMQVTYKITLRDTQGSYFCELEPETITLPNCTATPITNCAPACVGTDVVNNGDFESGYWAFSSDLEAKCYCAIGSYCINTDAADKCNDIPSLSGDGKFLVVQADTVLGASIWTQDVAVIAGDSYSFSLATYANITGDTLLPKLELWAGDSLLVADAQGDANKWTTINQNWIASTTDTIRLSVRQGTDYGTFGLDNIQFTQCNAATGDPLQDVAWLQAFVGNESMAIEQCTFEGQSLYRIATACADSTAVTYYDCQGNVICGFDVASNNCPADYAPVCTILQACGATAGLPKQDNSTIQGRSSSATLTNYPNPFRNSTTIAFELPTSTSTQLQIFDTNGRIVFSSVEVLEAGKHTITLDNTQLAKSGVYYYRLETNTVTLTRTMLLLE
ncbi:MAG: T9SS type A sorting domain-containing protein, partial [Bacteroidota bacterium]